MVRQSKFGPLIMASIWQLLSFSIQAMDIYYPKKWDILMMKLSNILLIFALFFQPCASLALLFRFQN